MIGTLSKVHRLSLLSRIVIYTFHFQGASFFYMVICMQDGMPYTIYTVFHAQSIKVNSITMK